MEDHVQEMSQADGAPAGHSGQPARKATWERISSSMAEAIAHHEDLIARNDSMTPWGRSYADEHPALMQKLHQIKVLADREIPVAQP